jgi:hypothetical protein
MNFRKSGTYILKFEIIMKEYLGDGARMRNFTDILNLLLGYAINKTSFSRNNESTSLQALKVQVGE